MKKASDFLEQLLSGLRIDDNREVLDLFSNWEDIVGPDIASHSRIKEIEGNTLIISVDHPGWSQIISMQKKQILRKIHHAYPELSLSYIRIVLGGLT